MNDARQFRWALGLLAGLIVAAVCIFSWWRVHSPLHSLSGDGPATEAESASQILPASHSIPWNKTSPGVAKPAALYGVFPSSLPSLDQIGEGVFNEEQLRVYFKNHTDLDLPTIVTNIKGNFQHHLTVDNKEIYGAEHMNFSLPPAEAGALHDLVSSNWKERYPTKDDGLGFSQGIRQYPTEFRDGEYFPVGTQVISYSSYDYQPRKRIYLLLNPTTGRMRLWWHYGDQ